MLRSREDSPSGFRCELVGWSVQRLSLPELAQLRQQPELRFPSRITSQFLKNSDDQTVASLVGIYDSIASMTSPPADFRDWGVVSASRYVGRSAFAATLHKYGTNGPCGVSVQVVPHHLLHSVSSTISLALPCQGPCLGAGGGLNGEVDALLAATSLVADPNCPGVWVTWTYWDPELLIDVTGKPTSDAQCVVGVMALCPLTDVTSRTQLEIRATGHSAHLSIPDTEGLAYGSRPVLTNLANSLRDVSRLRPRNFDVVCQFPGGLELEISCQSAPVETSDSAPDLARQSFAASK